MAKLGPYSCRIIDSHGQEIVRSINISWGSACSLIQHWCEDPNNDGAYATIEIANRCVLRYSKNGI